MHAPLRVFLGFSPNEMYAHVVAAFSIRRHTPQVEIKRICRMSLYGNYTRPTMVDENGTLWDEISGAPMSTDHAIARFFVPWLCDYSGWAVFMDGDILCRRDLNDLAKYANPDYALLTVHHAPQTVDGLIGIKKDHDVQLAYPRKNFSSVMLINCGHPANRALTLPVLNRLTGRDLHAFKWLDGDHQLGALPQEWNYLVNVTDPAPPDPAIVHYTLGDPTMPSHAKDPYAQEWFATARACGYKFSGPVAMEAAAEPRTSV